MFKRRQFLQLAALALPLPYAKAGFAGAGAEASSVPTLLSASWGDNAMGFGSVASPAVALPGRGHGIIPLPGGKAIVVSRRLGAWLAKIDWRNGQIVQLIDAEFDRHFFGHAILSPDGKTLITTENNGETGQGVLGLYAVDTLKRLGEIPSHGIGPHELLWLDQGKILAVANGGVLTLPETGRMKLNLGATNPALVLLDWPSGKLREQYVLPDQALSIRHLARSADGALGIALQAEYPANQQHVDAPLLAILRDGELRFAATVPNLQSYGASIAAVGNEFLVSALKGNALARWTSHGEALPPIPFERAAGIASDGRQAWVSSEAGMLAHYDPVSARLTPLKDIPPRRWDNHLVLAS